MLRRKEHGKVRKRLPAADQHNHPLGTVSETAKELNVKDQTVRKFMRLGLLTYVRVGRAIRIPRAALEEFMAQNTVPARRAGRQEL
jgi:excisionase family DNA binding protein